MAVFPQFILSIHETECFLVILVNARQLDYSSGHNLFKTMAKHPSDGSKNGDVGHAWIYLQGDMNGSAFYVEGGHSGELGIVRPKYFEGVMNYHDYGYSDPTDEEMKNPRYEPNPIKYLWASPKDGFFQEGSGGHTPTYAIKIDIDKAKFNEILRFINPVNYDYKDYAITRNQCSSFVTQVSALAGLNLADKVTIHINSKVRIFGKDYHLWTDSQYSTITFSSPDILQESMKDAVKKGIAEEATHWYKKKNPKSARQYIEEWQESIVKFPERCSRALLLR